MKVKNDICKICTDKLSVMTMLKKYNEFYCGVCGFRSKEDVKDLIVDSNSEKGPKEKQIEKIKDEMKEKRAKKEEKKETKTSKK